MTDPAGILGAPFAVLDETRVEVPGPLDVLPESSHTVALIDGPERRGRAGAYFVNVAFEGRALDPDTGVELALFRVGPEKDPSAPAPQRFMRVELGPGPSLLVWTWLDSAPTVNRPVYRVVARSSGAGRFRLTAGVGKVQLVPDVDPRAVAFPGGPGGNPSGGGPAPA